jgi:hypothetical protein
MTIQKERGRLSPPQSFQLELKDVNLFIRIESSRPAIRARASVPKIMQGLLFKDSETSALELNLPQRNIDNSIKSLSGERNDVLDHFHQRITRRAMSAGLPDEIFYLFE